MTEDATTRRDFLERSATMLTALALSPLTESSLPAASVPQSRTTLGGDELAALTLVEAASRIRARQLSPVELTQTALDRIAQLDPKVGAFITVTAEQALADARAAEREIQQGHYRGPLHGIPVGLKDTNYTRGVLTTARTQVLANFVPSFDATVVRRLKEAGAIVIGKTKLPEFSFGGVTPGTNNPWDLSRNAGGSSGGSAAALASGMLLGATGGDTSGSIRNPASACGVVGLKPTFGLVSCYGVVPISWTLDHVGPLAKTVEDTAILLQAMAGYDPNDPFSSRVAVPDYQRMLRTRVQGRRLGILPSSLLREFHPDTRNAFQKAVQVMEGLGARIEEVALPSSMAVARPAQTIIRICDAAAYHRQFLRTHAEQYGVENATLPRVSQVRTTVEAGSLITAAQYLRAQQVRKIFIQQMLQLFQSLDALLTPGTPAPAGESNEPSLSFRAEFNLCGFPAISIPTGFSTSPPGLPIGLQIAGRPFQDALVLALAYAYESATDWHKRKPNL